MKLYHSPTSPYVRKVMVLLHETGQLDHVELVPASTNPVQGGTLPAAKNPLGKVPTLEREDGPALYDSRVITRYLDHRAGGVLYPAPPRLWDTLTLEATADGILDAALLMVYETKMRGEGQRSDDWIEGQWGKIARALDAVGARWMSHLHGPLDMGQIAMACALGYVDLRHDSRSWRTGRDDLAAWAAKIAERPSLQATVPPA